VPVNQVSHLPLAGAAFHFQFQGDTLSLKTGTLMPSVNEKQKKKRKQKPNGYAGIN
jgi:hypothetical protein